MPRYAFRCEFDGAAFSGTAPQSGVRTLQDELRRILALLDGAEVLTRTCGRLDAGVSAEGLVFHAIMQGEREPLELARAINGHLKGEVAVLAVARVADDWDALLSASAKTYRYVVLEREALPVLDKRVMAVRHLPRASILPQLAAALVGDHDLSAFACLRGDPSDEADPVRHYHAASWRVEPVFAGRRHVFDIIGAGFLYKQVRGLVGAMVAVAQGSVSSAAFHAAIDAGRDHPRVGQVAPAEGLRLIRVSYDPEPNWITVGDRAEGP